MDSKLHDIVNNVMQARVHAERMADAKPQHAKSLKIFSAALERLRKEACKAAVNVAIRNRCHRGSGEKLNGSMG